MHFQCALASSAARMDLEGAIQASSDGSDEVLGDALTTAARKATITATTAANKTNLDLSTISARYGAPYLQFLTAWNGLYGNPWGYCMLGQARTIVKHAREALSVASKVWGHKDVDDDDDDGFGVEKIMLDVGEADLEGTLACGVTNAAEKLYYRVIDTLGGNQNDNDRRLILMTGLVNVHCLLGIAKLDLSSGDCDDANNAEESAQIFLGILADNRDSVQLQTIETIVM